MKYATGANPSPFDLRTFKYSGRDKSTADLYEVGESWENSEFIENQYKVGICTAISVTMKARKHYGLDFSDDFQYLLQKKYIDGNWLEGSSAFSACKAGQKYGFLPASEWTHTTLKDRKLSYSKYIKKLQAIPDSEIERLLEISKQYKIQAYARIKDSILSMASAINENGSIIGRFVIGNEWYREPIEPLSPPWEPISGHLVNITKRKGSSYRIANSWGTDWCVGGTAYGLYGNYPPTEMWQIWFSDVPKEIEDQLEQRKYLMGRVIDLMQQLLVLLKLV